MNRAVKRKLQSNHGASMILVLALFFTCIMVSSVIVFGASSGAGRSEERTRSQRGYLAVSSAAELITGEMKLANEYVGTNTVKRYGCEQCSIPVSMIYFGGTVAGYRLDGDYIPDPLDEGHMILPVTHPDMGEDKQTDGENTKWQGTLGEMVMRAAEHVFLMNTAYGETLTLELAITDERLPAVNVDFTMDEEYNMTFVLSAADCDYGLTVKVPGREQSGETQDVDMTGDLHTLYFKNYNSMTGAFEDVKEDGFAIPVEITTITTRVTWDIPKVEKGVQG